MSLNEAEIHLRNFIGNLQDRGMHGVGMVVSDNHAGRKAAREARLFGVPWQRCQFHLQQNAQKYVPRAHLRTQAAADLRAIFNAPDRSEAERLLALAIKKYADKAPPFHWMETNVPEGLTVFELPTAHRRRLRTSNVLERLNKEIKRRTRLPRYSPTRLPYCDC